MINLQSKTIVNEVTATEPATGWVKDNAFEPVTENAEDRQMKATVDSVSAAPVAGTDENKAANHQSAEVNDTSTGFFEIVRQYASVSDLLRLSGAIAVAVAMGLFLLDGIEVVNDLQRFLTMLGLTGALTAAGLAMSVLLKEQRGSRVFISLALLSVPVNFTVFGALLYSFIPLDAKALSYPGYAHWQVSSLSDLTLALAAGLAVLAPVIWLGYSVLARASRSWLSVALIASSAILIIPVRAELWSAALAIGTTVLLWMACRKYASNSLALKTTEGKLAVALLFVAPVIVAVRSLFFYDVDGVLILALSAGFFVYCRQLLSGITKAGVLSSALTLLTGLSMIGLCVAAGDLLVNFFPAPWVIFGTSLGLLALTIDLQRVSPNPVMSGVIGFIFAGLSALTLVAITVFWSGMTLWVALGLMSIAAYGAWFRNNLVALIGVIGLLALISLNAAELLFHAKSVWSTVLMTGWWGIAALGAVAIIAGSMIDRAGTVVKVSNQ